MAIKGTKEEIKQIKQELVNILWTGRYDKAIKYLSSIKNANIKNAKKLDDVRNYITRKSPNITCYALRHELGLTISSNRVEKANDIVVASRQKQEGISWSEEGSGALAVIKVALLDDWILTKSLNFAMIS